MPDLFFQAQINLLHIDLLIRHKQIITKAVYEPLNIEYSRIFKNTCFKRLFIIMLLSKNNHCQTVLRPWSFECNSTSCWNYSVYRCLYLVQENAMVGALVRSPGTNLGGGLGLDCCLEFRLPLNLLDSHRKLHRNNSVGFGLWTP